MNPCFADIVSAYVATGNSRRLSVATSGTLTVIAYRQLITRAQIAAIRGVSVDSIARTLVTYGLVIGAGTIVASGAASYGVTEYFFKVTGMSSLAELAPLVFYPSEVYGLQEEDTQ